MNIVQGILLVMLGLLTAREYLGQAVKPLGRLLARVAPYGQIFGLAGIIFGTLWLMEAAYLLINVHLHPVLAATIWFVAPLMICLGILLGLDLLSKIIGEPPAAFVVKLMHLRDDLRKHEKALGLLGILSGIFIMFI